MKTFGRIVAVLLVLLLLFGGITGSVWVAFSRSAAFADAELIRERQLFLQGRK